MSHDVKYPTLFSANRTNMQFTCANTYNWAIKLLYIVLQIKKIGLVYEIPMEMLSVFLENDNAKIRD